MLKKVLHPARTGMDSLQSSVERWERDARLLTMLESGRVVQRVRDELKDFEERGGST